MTWHDNDFSCFAGHTFYGRRNLYSAIGFLDYKEKSIVFYFDCNETRIGCNGKHYIIPFIDDTINYRDINPKYIDRLLSLKAFF